MSSMKLNRGIARRALPAASKSDLLWLKRRIQQELRERWQDEQALKARTLAAMQGMANVMAGVAWALACRDTLRRSKGHTPTGGKRPASGEMWLPRELLIALRAEIKERKWCPLGCASALECLNWLQVEAGRKPTVSDADADGFAAAMASDAGDLKVAQFKVRMASETCAVRFDPLDF
jgi:hypothetical protein